MLCSGRMAQVSTMIVRLGVRRDSHSEGQMVMPFLLVIRGGESEKIVSPKRLRIVRWRACDVS